MNTITVVCSTRSINQDYVDHVRKFFSHPKNQYIFVENNGDKSLTEVYNQGIEESENDIVVFIHDDLEFETKNLTPKIIKHLFNVDFDGFHFYDLPICLLNYMEGIKIGVTTKIKLYHLSIGEVDKKWKKSKLFFEALYEKYLPLKV